MPLGIRVYNSSVLYIQYIYQAMLRISKVEMQIKQKRRTVYILFGLNLHYAILRQSDLFWPKTDTQWK